MVAGIVIFAFGVTTTLAHVQAHLHTVAAVALCSRELEILVPRDELAILRRRLPTRG
jgi:hypothetical protein